MKLNQKDSFNYNANNQLEQLQFTYGMNYKCNGFQLMKMNSITNLPRFRFNFGKFVSKALPFSI